MPRFRCPGQACTNTCPSTALPLHWLALIISRGVLTTQFFIGVKRESYSSSPFPSQVISTATSQLLGEHPRSKLPASQMLALAAARAEFGSRVSDVALPAIVEVGSETWWDFAPKPH